MSEASQLKSILMQQENYRQTQEYRDQVAVNDQETLKTVLTVISMILKDPKSDPILQLQAVRFSKDVMELFNDDFITQFQFQVLPMMEHIALWEKGNDSLERGRNYFGDDCDIYNQKIGNSLLRLSLECIWVWSKWFPIDPDSLKVSCYRITLEKLILLKVKFPVLKYFEPKKVGKYMPECAMPMKVLEEMRRAVKIDIQQTYGAGSSSKIIQQRLSQMLQTELAKDDKEMIFYSDIFRRAYKQLQKRQLQERKDKENDQEENSVVIGYYEKKDNIDKELLLLNQQVKNLQNELLSNIQDKRNMQQKMREQNELINTLRQKIDIQEQRLSQLNQSRSQEQYYQPRFIQTSNHIVQF